MGADGGMKDMGTTQQVSSKDLDRAFINGMVPHHQAAIDMAKIEVEKGKNAQVKALAQAVIDVQTRERAEMDQIAKDLGFGVAQRHMSGPSGTLMGLPIRLDMAEMAKYVDMSHDPDRTFLEMMVPHHAMAISMATEERERGGDARLKSMSVAIIDAQAKEIGQMHSLLAVV
jgi:uncharacterized protein (DUF305 family)